MNGSNVRKVMYEKKGGNDYYVLMMWAGFTIVGHLDERASKILYSIASNVKIAFGIVFGDRKTRT